LRRFTRPDRSRLFYSLGMSEGSVVHQLKRKWQHLDGEVPRRHRAPSNESEALPKELEERLPKSLQVFHEIELEAEKIRRRRRRR